MLCLRSENLGGRTGQSECSSYHKGEHGMCFRLTLIMQQKKSWISVGTQRNIMCCSNQNACEVQLMANMVGLSAEVVPARISENYSLDICRNMGLDSQTLLLLVYLQIGGGQTDRAGLIFWGLSGVTQTNYLRGTNSLFINMGFILLDNSVMQCLLCHPTSVCKVKVVYIKLPFLYFSHNNHPIR